MRYLLTENDIAEMVNLAYHNGSITQDKFGEWPEQKFTKNQILKHFLLKREFQPWYIRFLNFITLSGR